MRGKDQMEPGEGERLHAQQRKRLWGIHGGLMVIGLSAGLLSGLVIGGQTVGADFAPATVTAAIAGAILIPIIIVWASWRFLAWVDELEVADNLWASLVGFCAYVLLFPTWWVLWKLGTVPEPNDWAIWGATMFLFFVTYAYRKWQQR